MTALRAKTPSARGRASKRRGAQDERDVARIIGGRRHLADTGGPEDIRHDWLAVQVKGGGAVVTRAMRDGHAQAVTAAGGHHKLAAVVLVDRRGTRLRRYIAFELQEYANWMGIKPTEDDE